MDWLTFTVFYYVFIMIDVPGINISNLGGVLFMIKVLFTVTADDIMDIIPEKELCLLLVPIYGDYNQKE